MVSRRVAAGKTTRGRPTMRVAAGASLRPSPANPARCGNKAAETLPAVGRYPRASLIHRVPVSKRGKIVLLHFVGQMPLAGIAWQAVNYLVGLEKLGYETWYVEDHGANPYDPRISSVVMDCEYNLAYLRTAMERHGLAGRWADKPDCTRNP